MRMIDSPGDTLKAIEREAARRYFDSVDNVDAEIERHNIDLYKYKLDALINRITSDPYRQEAFVRKVGRVETELDGEKPVR